MRAVQSRSLTRSLLPTSAVVVAVVSLACGGKSYRTELDKHGGLSFVLTGEPGCALTDAGTVVQQRLDSMPHMFGVASVDQDQLHVQVAGESLAGQVPASLFKLYHVEFAAVLRTQTGSPGPSGRWLVNPDNADEYLQIESPSAITSAQIASASSETTDYGTQVLITFDDTGAERFATLTGRTVGQQVAIIIDDVVVSAPVVNEAIRGGQAVITGNDGGDLFSMVAALNQPPLPCPLTIIEQNVIGPAGGR